jgi:hypothetical protein
MIQIENDGPDIVSSNYWESEWNKRGVMACSFNAGFFRLMLPDSMHDQIPEMMTGKVHIISKGNYQGQPGYEFMFDDNSDAPYTIHIGANQMVSFQLSDSEHGKAVFLSVWIHGPEKIMETPARFRVVGQLPYLRPWEK